MEPFSPMAVISLCSEVAGYVMAVTGAPKERRSLRKQIRACEHLLQEIKDDEDDCESKPVAKSREALRSLLKALQDSLNAVKHQLRPKGGIKKALDTLMWPFKKTDIDKILKSMEQEKFVLQAYLTKTTKELVRENNRIARENNELLTGFKDDFQEVKDAQGVLLADQQNRNRARSNQEAAEERKIILDWLTPTDYAPQQQKFISLRQPKTGQWLLDSSKFKSWRDGNTKTLFCQGIPGAGKTILTSIVVEDLKTRFKKDKTIGISYIYCKLQRRGEISAMDLLASLLKQLSQGLSALPSSLKLLHNRNKKKSRRPSLAEISKTLQSVVSEYSRVFIMVDGLDNCQHVGDCLTTFLPEIFKLQKKGQVGFFATSRHILDVSENFKKSDTLEIRASEEDIGSYLDDGMAKLPSFVTRQPNLQAEIKRKIIKACDGMFLLAKPHLDSLNGKINAKSLRAALANLPSGKNAYKQVYGDAIVRIKRQERDQVELAKQVISWVAYAKRPLTTSELQHALAVEVGTSELDQENLADVELIVSVCAGLITVDAEDMVRFVHSTIQEYLEHDEKEWLADSKFHISEVCATYLSFSAFASGFCSNAQKFEKRLRSHPFYEYAACNWGHHAREASKPNWAIAQFLKDAKKVQASSQALLTATQSPCQSNFGHMGPENMTGLHLVAYFGVNEIAKVITEKENDVDFLDTHSRTPLSYAAENGHLSVVKLLCKKGADITSRSNLGRTPLSYAAENGHKRSAAFLLEKGAEAESEDNNGRASLSYATVSGHRAIVELLLEKEARIDSKDILDWTPLLYATEGGQQKTVQILLENGANIKGGHGGDFKLLLCAIENGNKSIFKMLLEKGAEVESRDAHSRTPLSYAAESGDQAIVELLLKYGANPDTKDAKGKTPLSYAKDEGHKSIAKLLSGKKENMKSKNPKDVA